MDIAKNIKLAKAEFATLYSNVRTEDKKELLARALTSTLIVTETLVDDGFAGDDSELQNHMFQARLAIDMLLIHLQTSSELVSTASIKREDTTGIE